MDSNEYVMTDTGKERTAMKYYGQRWIAMNSDGWNWIAITLN